MQRFEITILGTGSASPTTKRNPSAQLLNAAERFFLIDCGEGTQMQLRKYKLNMHRIDHILISHLHGDHYLGLLGLLQSMHLLGRKKPLYLFCFPELKEIIDIQNKHSQTVLNYEIIYNYTDPKQPKLLLDDKKLSITSFPLSHRIACCGFMFREKEGGRKIVKEALEKYKVSIAEIHKLRIGQDAINDEGDTIANRLLTKNPDRTRSFAYCSDTCYFEDILPHIANADLLYHESTFLKDMKDRARSTFHSTAEDAATIAQKANVKKLLLGHFSARYEDSSPFLLEARPLFDNTLLALEGEKVKI
ncbi:MAG: ribonuclease [Bacteroidetes bacterium]|jgi:ribonuclease Z|nr:ribonuclease [Bacteroidota bacterium]